MVLLPLLRVAALVAMTKCCGVSSVTDECAASSCSLYDAEISDAVLTMALSVGVVGLTTLRAVVSLMTFAAGEALLELPAGSVSVTDADNVPSARLLTSTGTLYAPPVTGAFAVTVPAPPSLVIDTSTTSPVTPAPLTVRVCPSTLRASVGANGVAGAATSLVAAWLVSPDSFPAPSIVCTANEMGPSVSGPSASVVAQLPLPSTATVLVTVCGPSVALIATDEPGSAVPPNGKLATLAALT